MFLCPAFPCAALPVVRSVGSPAGPWPVRRPRPTSMSVQPSVLRLEDLGSSPSNSRHLSLVRYFSLEELQSHLASVDDSRWWEALGGSGVQAGRAGLTGLD